MLANILAILNVMFSYVGVKRLKVNDKKGNISKRKLIDAAICLIAQEGDTEKVSIRDIAAKAEVSTACVLYHFKSRAVLLKEVSDFLLSYIHETPIESFYKKNSDLFATKEGQVIFISDLFSAFRDFFLNISKSEMNYCNAFRVLIHSREIEDDICINPKFFKKDAIAFYEIYKTITGNDDLEMSHFLYMTYFDTLSTRLTASKNPEKLDNDHQFSHNYDTRFFYFCRRQLLMALDLLDPVTSVQVK